MKSINQLKSTKKPTFFKDRLSQHNGLTFYEEKISTVMLTILFKFYIKLTINILLSIVSGMYAITKQKKDWS